MLRVRCQPPLPTSPAGANTALEFAVFDTGPGIAPADLPQLFEPFCQPLTERRWAETGLDPSGQGSGLGLSISQQFVRLMGGDLTVESQVGQGSVFRFTLPVERVDAAAMSVLPNPATILGLAPDQPPYRLLVVDDHPANRHLLERLLQSVGFEVRTAADGQSALEETQRWRPHLVWMDLRMPGLDGYATTLKIRSLELTPPPVVIALTSSPFEDDRAKILAAGCDDFLAKPFRLETLLHTLATHLPVRYLYGAASGGTPAPNQRAIAAWLQTTPAPWQAKLAKAARAGSDGRLLQLLEQREEAPPAIAQTLTTWAKNFEFDRILACLPPACG